MSRVVGGLVLFVRLSVYFVGACRGFRASLCITNCLRVLSSRRLAILLFPALLASCADIGDGERTLKVGHTLDINHPVHEALIFMSQDLKERSNGEMELTVYSSGQLGSERELIELLQLGALDMAKVSASPLEGFAEQMGVFGLPYLFRDNGHFWSVLDGPIGKELLASLEPVRLVGLGFFDAGSRSFYTKNANVNSPDQLAGQKIRVMNSAMAIATMDAFGASATPLPGGEVYTALQQGLVDAAENNPPTYLSSRHYEVAPYYSLDEHSAIPDVVLLSAASKSRLTQQQFGWLEESMQAASLFQRKKWAQATQKALTELEENGVIISRPDKQVFRSSVDGIYSRNQGGELGDLARRILNTQKGEVE